MKDRRKRSEGTGIKNRFWIAPVLVYLAIAAVTIIIILDMQLDRRLEYLVAEFGHQMASWIKDFLLWF